MLHSKLKKSHAMRSNSNITVPLLCLCTVFSLVLSPVSFGADELSSVMNTVKENFGANSTFIKILYVAEIIVGGYTWHKTKSPAAIIGIVVLAVFVNFAFGHWVK